MNILFNWAYKIQNSGGVGRVTETLGQEFLRKGHNVSFLSISPGEEYDNDGIRQYFCPSAESPGAEENIRYITNLLQQLNIDVIINQTGTVIEYLLPVTKANINNIPIVSVHHNCVKCMQEHHKLIVSENYRDRSYYPFIKNPLVLEAMKRVSKRRYARFFKICLDHSDKLVLLSEHYIPELYTFLDEFDRKKVAGLPNPASFKVRDNVEGLKENRLVYVGRINFSQKRADLLVELWEKVSSEFPNWEFDVVGNGEQLQDLKNKALEEGLSRIYFHGFQDPKPFLEKAKIFTMTSAYEGFPMVITEALAYGVVPIAFDSFGALREVIEPGSNGLIIDPFDIKTYAAELSELIKNDEHRKIMAKNGRLSIERFEVSKVADRWLDLLQQTVTERKMAAHE